MNSLFFIDDSMTLKRIEGYKDKQLEVKMVLDLMKVYPSQMIGELRQLRKE